MRLEHIGIAVDDIDRALATFEALLGRAPYKTEEVPSESVITHFFDLDGTKIELLQPMDPESVVARFVARRGGGIHHLAFQVDDLEDVQKTMEAKGFRVLGDGIRQGADGKRVLFLHPKDTAGVLIEYCTSVTSDD